MIAATDYVRQVPQMIAEYVDAPYRTLGADGFGRSDTRTRLRAFFEVDPPSIAVAALSALADIDALPRERVASAIATLGVPTETPPPWRV